LSAGFQATKAFEQLLRARQWRQMNNQFVEILSQTQAPGTQNQDSTIGTECLFDQFDIG